MKAAGEDSEKYAEAMSKVVDGLRGEAFIIAKELGLEKIWDVGKHRHGVGSRRRCLHRRAETVCVPPDNL